MLPRSPDKQILKSTQIEDIFSIFLQIHPTSKSIPQCKQLHAKLVTINSTTPIHVTNTLLSFYSNSGYPRHALKLFEHMPLRNVVTWTTLISSHTRHSRSIESLKLFREMLESRTRPNQHTLSSSLRACTSLKFCKLGLQIHGLVIRAGFEKDEFSGSSLVDMYFKLGDNLEHACRVFRGLFKRDSVSWNVLISGFLKAGRIDQAFGLLLEMQVVDGLKPNDFTITGLLRYCGVAREVKHVHGMALKFGFEGDVVVGSALMDSYGKCGDIDSGTKVFDSMVWRDAFVWSSIISAYARHGRGEESVALLKDMCRQGMRPDQHALSSSLKACCEIRNKEIGIQTHAVTIKNGYQSDCFVASVLLTLYAEVCEMSEVEKLFSRITDKDIVAWNSMITACAQMKNGSAASCFRLFRDLCTTSPVKPDGSTFISILKPCRTASELVIGIQIHGMIMKSTRSRETRVTNAIIGMYSKCGDIDGTYKAFEGIAFKDEISWSSVIGSYQHEGFELEALRLCKEMLAHGIHLTDFSLPLCISACSGVAAIEMGKQFHSLVIKSGLNSNVYVGSTVIYMYAKCGYSEDSKKAFDEQEEPNEVVLNSVISGFGQHGKAIEAIQAFNEMEKMGLVPNQITFLAVFSACSHAGLVEESLFFFDLMQKKYGIKPESEHYSCMVDIFGRAGRLVEALRIIKNDENVSAWRALLSASRNYGDVEIAIKSAKKVMELDPCDHSSYILLSNLYSRQGKWEEAVKLRHRMADVGVKKDPGNSWLAFIDRIE